MIPGIVAAASSAAAAGGSPTEGLPTGVGMNPGEALLDIAGGTALVEGVSYDLTELFTDAPIGFGFFTPSRIIPGSGYLSDSESPAVGAVAISPLSDLLLAPHCLWMEILDAGDGGGECLHYISDATDNALTLVSLATNSWQIDGPTVSAYFNPPDDPYLYGVLNRVGYNLGTAEGNFAINGAMEGADEDLTGFFDVNTGGAYNEVPMPLGAFNYSGAADGFIRWIAIKPPLTDTSELVTLTTI